MGDRGFKEYVNPLIIGKTSVKPFQDQALPIPVPHIRPSILASPKSKVNKLVLVDPIPEGVG